MTNPLPHYGHTTPFTNSAHHVLIIKNVNFMLKKTVKGTVRSFLEIIQKNPSKTTHTGYRIFKVV